MPILTHPSFGPRAALLYVTTGALLDVWTGVWYFAFRDTDVPLASSTKFWLLGFFLTGLTLMVIGLLLGPLGQHARKAELPPADAVATEARIEQTAAAHPPAMVTPAAGVAPPATTAPVRSPQVASPPAAPAVGAPPMTTSRPI